MSLRFRLNLLITALSLAGMLLAGWVVINATRTSIREGVEAATRDMANAMLAKVLAVNFESFTAPGAGLALRVNRPDIQGAALVHESRCEHLAAFCEV